MSVTPLRTGDYRNEQRNLRMVHRNERGRKRRFAGTTNEKNTTFYVLQIDKKVPRNWSSFFIYTITVFHETYDLEGICSSFDVLRRSTDNRR